MRTTIDRAGRIIIPKQIRDELGFEPGEVEIQVEGAAVLIEPVTRPGFTTEGRFLVIDEDVPLDNETVRELRLRDQR